MKKDPENNLNKNEIDQLKNKLIHLEQMFSQSGKASMAALFDTMFEGVQILDFDWRYVYVNPTAAEHGRRSCKELLGQCITDMYPGIDQTDVFTLMKQCMEKRKPCQMVNQFTYPDGKQGWFDLRMNPVPVGILMLSVDITQNMELEGRKLHSQKMESVGQLAGGVAHDFNNLLTVISGYAEDLAQQVSAHGAEAVQEIRHAADQAASLTRQLLAFSRRQVLKPEFIDLNAIIHTTSAMLKRLLGEAVELEVHLAQNLDAVFFDAGQVEQILMNLALNARDAMPRGGMLTVETSNVVLDQDYAAKHADCQAGPHVMLAVSDTGSGIDPAIRKKIFDPFFTTKEIGHGTGLGLSTVYGIVKQSGGNIWVYSEPGKGSTFKVYLPSEPGKQTAAAPVPDSAQAARGHSETVLLVEDEDGVRKLFSHVLKKNGYQVLAASSGAQALQKCSSHKESIDLLLTDVIMPGMGGRELAAQVQKLQPGIKVVYMSGYTPNAIVHNGMLDEGTNFIEKPITPSRLLVKLREFL